MENFDQYIPVIEERNKNESDNSIERSRQLLSNSIDMAAIELQEFAVPDYQSQTNESFQVFRDQYHQGSFDCRYENGVMQHATIELKGRENHFDATLAYDQDDKIWLLHTLDAEEPRPVTTLHVMKSMLTPTHYTDKMVNGGPEDFEFNDLIELFAKKSTGFIDKKTYIATSIDEDSMTPDSVSETATVLEVSSSRDEAKNYRSLEVAHQTTNFDADNNPETVVDKEYRQVTGKKNVSFINKGLTPDEAGNHLKDLKDQKLFANL